MAKKKTDETAEEKIKAAARKLFIQKGFAATRTREIADEAGINLALLNYYFGGKQNLFNLIMEETLLGFLEVVSIHFHNPDTTLNEKMEHLSKAYIEFLLERPDLPIFILSELRNQKKVFFEKVAGKLNLKDSAFFTQLRATYHNPGSELMIENHVLMNLISMIMFPILGAPVVKLMLDMNDSEYKAQLEMREEMIPEWIGNMFSKIEKD